MDHSLLYPSIGALLLILAAVVRKLQNVGRRPPGLPPGPPTLPLIGNLHQMPRKDPHLQFKKWSEEFGPVYSLVLGTKIMIVLSSDQAVRDLLDKRSNIYSDRPDMYMLRLIGDGNNFLATPYGDTWRFLRKLCNAAINVTKAKAYVPYQDLESKMLLDSMSKDPERWLQHVRRFTHSITTQLLFGFRTADINDPTLGALYQAVDGLSELLGSTTGAVLEVYPFLRKLPYFSLPSSRRARALCQRERSLFSGLWSAAKRAALGGRANPCLANEMVEKQQELCLSDDFCGWTLGNLLEAGSDTTANTLCGFVQAMILFPAAQRQAQAELDRVCGDGRLPTMDDMDDLPYIRACVKESLRWMTTMPLGVPHKVTQEDAYMGYRIPSGATVLCNVYAIHMDENRHPRPREFEPLRYINDNTSSQESATSADVRQRDHFTFGAGRRICQGMHIADRSLLLAEARLLWAFTFAKVVGDDGEEIAPDPDNLRQGFLVQPEPFPVRISPRSQKHADVLKKNWEACQELLDEGNQWQEFPQVAVRKS